MCSSDLVPALTGVALYTRGLWRWRERSRAHPWWRSALFYLGMLTLFAAVNSPLHVLSERHFSSHMVQHLLVMTVGVPLILLGAPTTPVLRGLPRLPRRGSVTVTRCSRSFDGLLEPGCPKPIAAAR